ncbi:hypothetical protein ACSSS7_005850 [Eimeria intestinalis]
MATGSTYRVGETDRSPALHRVAGREGRQTLDVTAACNSSSSSSSSSSSRHEFFSLKASPQQKRRHSECLLHHAERNDVVLNVVSLSLGLVIFMRDSGSLRDWRELGEGGMCLRAIEVGWTASRPLLLCVSFSLSPSAPPSSLRCSKQQGGGNVYHKNTLRAAAAKAAAEAAAAAAGAAAATRDAAAAAGDAAAGIDAAAAGSRQRRQDGERIPKGAFVMQYVGEVIPRAVMDGRSRQEARKGYHNYCMEVVGEESDLEYDWAAPCIDSLVSRLPPKNPSSSSACSAMLIKQTCRTWKGGGGAALTYAYGPGYEEMLCLCGAPNCEGFIGGGTGDAGDKGPPLCSVSLAFRAGALKAKSLQPKAAEAQRA